MTASVTRLLARRLWPWFAAVLVVALVVALGGFDKRTDQLVPTSPGVEIDSHNLVFTLTSATLQSVADFSGKREWRVVAAATVRNPNDETLYPLLGPTGNFVLHDPASKRTAEPESVRLGDSDQRSLVPPGDTPMAMEVSFDLPAEYQPQASIEVGVFPMEYTDSVILGLGGGELAWNLDSYASAALVTLPLTRLPDAEG